MQKLEFPFEQVLKCHLGVLAACLFVYSTNYWGPEAGQQSDWSWAQRYWAFQGLGLLVSSIFITTWLEWRLPRIHDVLFFTAVAGTAALLILSYIAVEVLGD